MNAVWAFPEPMLWLYWLSISFLLYTFFGYPLLLWVAALGKIRRSIRSTIYPQVTIIIPAYNEAHVLEKKIRNTLDLTYPKHRLEVIVASDASNDGTDDIARSFAREGVTLVRLPERRGKEYAQMIALNASHGEILLFTDAAVELEPCLLQNIVSNFADPSIGCVSTVDWVPTEAAAQIGEQIYVRFEMEMRRLEETVGSLVGASGSCFAARREVCKEWNPDHANDFSVPLRAVAAGMRTVADPECRARYTVVSTARAELKRKVRTIVNGLNVLFDYRALLNPLRYGFFSVQLVSHKLFRWLVPFAALCLLISNIFLWESGIFYRASLLSQLVFYVIGSVALTASPVIPFKAIRAIGFFLLGNAATLMAWHYFLSGEKFVLWQPSRRA
jgi:cellulose synthase/poly-beta-1,6-N-acetylglucosamine synthase-like glycosyltransferase